MPKTNTGDTHAGIANRRRAGAAGPVHKIYLKNFRSATARMIRDINRRVVLNLIRTHQPVSRAEVARLARLQRSTVSAITEQLIAERWVTTGASGYMARGRKPTLIHFNASRAGVIGIDVQPSETRIALADLEMRFLEQQTIATDRDASQFISRLCDHACRLIESHPHIACEGIGLALPGRIEPGSNRLIFAPSLGWESANPVKPLAEATGLSVELENVANACAMAEIWSKAHPENVLNLVTMTISEDINVGMVLNGQLVRGTTGMAGEFGHVVIEEEGPLCRCGRRGCLEVFASNAAVVRSFSRAARREDAGPVPPSFDSILGMAEKGDPRAWEALNRMAYYLGAGVAMITTGLSPDVIVLVGEFTRAWRKIGPVINNIVKERSGNVSRTRIVPAGPETRLRGAAAIVAQRHFGALQAV